MTRAKTFAQILADKEKGIEIHIEREIEDQRKNKLLKNIIFWHIFYLIAVSAIFNKAKGWTESNNFSTISFSFVAVSSFVIFTVGKGGTSLAVPAVAVTNSAITDDITRARGRMFEKMMGPLLGYAYAVIFFILSIIIYN